MMIGLDSYTATKESFVGVDWLNLTSGAFKTAGGAAASALESGSTAGAGQAPTAQAAAEKAKLEAAQKAAEQSATMWKRVGVAAVVVLGGWLFLRHRAAPKK